MTVSTGAAQVQAGQIPSPGEMVGIKCYPLAKELLAISRLPSQAESVFIKELAPDALTTPQCRPYPQGYLGNINWTPQEKREKRNFKFGWEDIGRWICW